MEMVRPQVAVTASHVIGHFGYRKNGPHWIRCNRSTGEAINFVKQPAAIAILERLEEHRRQYALDVQRFSRINDV